MAMPMRTATRINAPAKRRTMHRPAAGVAAIAAVVAATAAAQTNTDPSFLLSAGMADLKSYFPGYLANGYLSTTTTRRGTEAAPAYLIAFMDYHEQDISRPATIPGWTEIDFSTGPTATGQAWLNKAPLDAAHFQDYRQTLNLHDGTLTTRYRYLEGSKTTLLEVTTLISEAAPHLAASRLSITPEFDGVVQLSFAMNLWAPHVPRFALASLTGAQMEQALVANGLNLEPGFPARADRAALWYGGDTHVLADEADPQTLTMRISGRAEAGSAMAEAAAVGLPPGLVPEEVTVYKSDYRLALDIQVRVQRSKTYVFTKYAAFSRDEWGGDADEDLRLALAARTAGFEVMLRDHVDAWARLWQTDIVIDGDPDAQRLTHSELYYLYASSTAGTAWPIGACAMTPGYAGHVFWDADSWIVPALLLLQPERAKPLVAFRKRTLASAQARAQARGFAGAMYPWEADPENGTEQTPHFAYVLGEREIHVNSDVSTAQWQFYLATGDRDWLVREAWPVIRDVARFWVSRATQDPGGHRDEILHVTSVDEAYSDVPNDTFTNLGAVRALRIAAAAARIVGERADPRWQRLADRLFVAFDPGGKHHLEFDPSIAGHPEGRGGGALTLLFLPVLDIPMNEALRRADLEFADRDDPVSHAALAGSMGLPPQSIAAATIGDGAAAAGWFRGNFTGGTLKPPFNVRTESAENNTGYFLTGSAGYLQTLLYGFSGLRVREAGLVQAYAPMLPPAWKSMTLRNISVRGRRLDIRIAPDADGRIAARRRQR